MVLINPYQQYQQNSVMTASPGELILMMYDGAIRFIKQAKVYMEHKDIEKVNNAILRTQDIVAELMATLDMGYEISHGLYALYDFIMDQLIQANVKKEQQPLDTALEILNDLRQTWSQAIKLYRQQEYAGG